jgi:DNA primase
VVFPESGTWRCFGQCNEGGDIFKFVMKKENWDFSEALHYLAEQAGVQLKPPTPQEQAADDERQGLRGLLEEAVLFYHSQLVGSPAGRAALEYLRERRKLKDETLEAFGVGYAPQGWEVAMQHFLGRGWRLEDLAGCGLVVERDGGGYRDRFRQRIMFPIRDGRGRMAGFGGRVVDPDDIPKFLNTPQTALFDKSRLLYGLERARRSIQEKQEAVIVEGYLDVLAVHQAGFTNVVSAMGTALSEHHLHLLKRYCRRIVLALDADAAGEKATLRGLEVARRALDRSEEAVFDARGLLGFERRLNADIRVGLLPRGLDPDEVVLGDAREWERVVAEARPVVVHVMESLAAGRDLEDAKVKGEIAAQVLPLIEDVAGAVEREAYRQRLARLLHVDERALAAGGAARPGRAGRTAARRSVGQANATQAPALQVSSGLLSSYALEAHCLGILLRRLELVYKVDRKLQGHRLGRLAAEDFQHSDHQAVFKLLQESTEQDMAEPLNFVMDHFSLPLMELADGLLARTSELDLGEDKVLEDLMRGLLELRRRNLRQRIDYLRFLMQEAQEQGEMKAPQYVKEIVKLTKTLNLVNQALGQYTSHAMVLRQGD